MSATKWSLNVMLWKLDILRETKRKRHTKRNADLNARNTKHCALSCFSCCSLNGMLEEVWDIGLDPVFLFESADGLPSCKDASTLCGALIIPCLSCMGLPWKVALHLSQIRTLKDCISYLRYNYEWTEEQTKNCSRWLVEAGCTRQLINLVGNQLRSPQTRRDSSSWDMHQIHFHASLTEP